MLTIYDAAKIDIIFLGGMDLNPWKPVMTPPNYKT